MLRGGLLCALLLGLGVPAAASAFTWTGEATKGLPGWSEEANWQGGLAPLAAAPVALSFPHLTGPACEGSSPVDSCYHSSSNLTGFLVESMLLDDGDEYELEGNQITLGAGGLAASPAAGTSGAAGDVIDMPLDLDASQTWTVSGREGGSTSENGLAVAHGLTGEGEHLTLDLADGAIVYLEGGVEVGPLAVDGTGTGAEGVLSLEGKVNSEDGQTVSVNHALFAGEGAVGPLVASSAKVLPAGRIEAASVDLDSGSEAIFELVGVLKSVAHSELISHGAIDLGSAKLSVRALPASSPYGTCPDLSSGQTYTLLSTTGPLTGVFANAHEGWEIPIQFEGGCTETWSMQISYQQSGSTETVTGTLVAGPPSIPPPPLTVNPYKIESSPPTYFASSEPWVAPTVTAPTPSRVLLQGARLTVEHDAVLVKLRCSGSEVCEGRLLLSASSSSKPGGRHASIVSIGSISFSLDGNTTRTVKIKLNREGHDLLHGNRGHMNAELAIGADGGASSDSAPRRVRLVS